jgi:hypothetical protein
MTEFNNAQILLLLHELEAQLASKNQSADIYLVGGAAIALSFDLERTTRDLDAVFVPTDEVRSAVLTLATKYDLNEDWLNDAAKGFIPPSIDVNEQVLFETEHLRVCTASAEHLLAMKIAAARVESDRGDIAMLLGILEISNVDVAIEFARKVLGPNYPIPPRAQYLIQEILDHEGSM